MSKATSIVLYSENTEVSPPTAGRTILRADYRTSAELIMTLPFVLPTANQVLATNGDGTLYWRTIANTYQFSVVTQTVGAGSPNNPTATETIYQYYFDNASPASRVVTLPTLTAAEDGLPMFIKITLDSVNFAPLTPKFTIEAGAGNTLERSPSGTKELEKGNTAHLIWDNANLDWIIV